MLRFFVDVSAQSLWWYNGGRDRVLNNSVINYLSACTYVRVRHILSAVHSPTHPLTVHDYVRRAFVIDWCRKQRNLRWCNFTNSVMITSRWCDAEAVHVLRSLSYHFSTIRFTCEGIFVLSSDCNTPYILHSVTSSDRALDTIGFDILYT